MIDEVDVVDNVMELRAIPDLMNMNFFIPEYQRGYRWENIQVKQLLDDLLTYFKSDNKEAFYCLQPIVVKLCDPITKADNNLDEGIWYEVIDGQQRLTTIRILCALQDSMEMTSGEHSLNIHYSTRPDMDYIYDTLSVVYNSQEKLRELKIDGRKWDNLDSVYIYNAAKAAVEWFNQDKSRKNIFGSYFFNGQKEEKKVQVVWYEDCGNKDARDLFNEINDLTIKLSCSELIRSLFLSSNAKFECNINLKGINDDSIKERLIVQDKINRQRYINTKWDEIEHRLSDYRIQTFITNNKPKGLRNNIELLFDLISEKNSGNENLKKDPLFTFIYFNDEIKKSNASALWQIVEEYYSRLCGWMENREYYHKIGYLNAIADDDSTVIELLSYAQKHKKDEMSEELNRRIKESMKYKKKLSELSYEDRNDYQFIKKVLFLYNVELNRIMKAQEPFPFELFKPLKSWTLEHIHAQNSECLPPDKRNIWIEWCRLNEDTLKTLKFSEDYEYERNAIISELDKVANGLKKEDKTCTHKSVTALFDRIANLYDSVGDDKSTIKPVHQLSNMALLSQSVNSSVGCSAFAVKRQSIQSLRNEGYYFPIATMNVFQKSYSTNQHFYEWSYQDRRSYLDSIESTLSNYIRLDQ